MTSSRLQARYYKKHLYPNEKVLLITERHSVKRLPIHIAVVIFVAGIATGLYSILYTLEALTVLLGITIILWAMCLLFAYFLAWTLLLERRGLVFTDGRLMIFEHDAFSRSHRIIPYERIEEATIKENFFSHIFGYGDLRLVIHEEEREAIFKGYTELTQLETIISEYIGPRTRDGFPTWKL